LLPRPTDFFFFTRNLFFLHQLLTGYLIHHIGSGDSRAPKAQSSHLKRRPAPGAPPRPARRTLPAGCRAATWPAACAQSLSSPAFDHEPLSSKWAAAEEEALPQAEVARRRYVRGPQSFPRRLGPVGGGLIDLLGGICSKKMITLSTQPLRSALHGARTAAVLAPAE
jgi:hypothetical protein